MFSKILVAVGGPDDAEETVPVVAGLAKAFNSEVLVVHMRERVVTSATDPATGCWPNDDNSRELPLSASAKRKYRRSAARSSSAHLMARWIAAVCCTKWKRSI